MAEVDALRLATADAEAPERMAEVDNLRLAIASAEAAEKKAEVDTLRLGNLGWKTVLRRMVEPSIFGLGELSPKVAIRCLVSLSRVDCRISRRILCSAEAAHNLHRHGLCEEVCMLNKNHLLSRHCTWGSKQGYTWC